ncbi:isoamyl acetate-hydrolyzing esterase [Coemansia sp. RSA 2050]|nr:isoamyl acetate-hydrolyzing esterase [Coemansia sp. RSA 2050]KAJ2731136.1 isoamyl acetate-hydrolyzing esterase [Coemansia sp. BCRC 34962]
MPLLAYDTFLCFGDSLTQHGWDVSKSGWVAQLSQAYVRRLDVVSRGFSGYTSRWTLPLLPQVLPLSSAAGSGQPRPRLLTILLGSNDALLPGHLRHVPIAEFKANITRMVTMVTGPDSPHYSPETRILLITPPALGERLYAHHRESVYSTVYPVDRTPESVRACADAMREVAAEMSLPCVDFWAAVEEGAKEQGGELDGYDAYSWDGVHLNKGGNDLLFALVMKAIRSHYPELDPDVLPLVVLGHRERALLEEKENADASR